MCAFSNNLFLFLILLLKLEVFSSCLSIIFSVLLNKKMKVTVNSNKIKNKIKGGKDRLSGKRPQAPKCQLSSGIRMYL